MDHPARPTPDRRPGLLAVVIPLAAPFLLRFAPAHLNSAAALTLGGVALVITGGIAAWAVAPVAGHRRHPFVAAAAFLLATLAALDLLRPLGTTPVPTLRAMGHFLAGACGPLAAAVVLVAAGGLVAGRLASGQALVARLDPLHWLLGAVLAGIVGLPLGTAADMVGHWLAPAAACWLMAAATMFWTLWARAEVVAAVPAALPAHRGRPQGARHRFPRRRRRSHAPLPDPRIWAETVWTVICARPEGRPLPVQIALADARTSLARLLGLYAWTALGAAPLLLLLLLGSRAGWLWIDPSRLPAPWPAIALVLGLLTLALPTALAIRRGFLHPQELLRPLPRALPWLAATAGTLLLTLLGGAHLDRRGVLGALHLAPVANAAVLVALAAVTTAFCQGLLQTRLEDLFPNWISVGVPALVLAISGTALRLPLPAPPMAFVLGIWLGIARRMQGVIATTAALAVAWALTAVLIR